MAKTQETCVLFSHILDTITKKGDTIILSKEEIKFMQINPVLFQKIQDEVNKTITQNEINYHDIPQIICIMVKIYKEHFIVEEIENIGLMNVIRFTINSIIESNVNPLSEMELQIIEKIVDASLTLLNTSINEDVKNEKSCFRFFC